MVLSDLNILCIGQKRRTTAPVPGVNIEASNRNSRKYSPIYGASWPILQRIKGIWYSIEPAARGDKPWDLGTEFFDLPIEPAARGDKPWDPGTELFDLPVEKPRKLMVVSGERSTDMVGRLLDHYLEESPIKTVGFLLRLQDDEEETFRVMSREAFLRDLADGKIMYNLAYFIQKTECGG